ncbi:redoxin domain-containing protein [Pedobacter frigidisoli]|nr:redoxin domain-containing protein [Pedobacter frigidisoli]
MKLELTKRFIFTALILFVLLAPERALSQQQVVFKDIFKPLVSSLNTPEIIGALAGYTFTDTLGNQVRLSDFLGKWVMVDLWYSGCGGCITANEGMRTVHDSLSKQGVVFLSISVDREREKWMASITHGAQKSSLNPWAGMYVPAKGTITLYTSGSGHDNEFRRAYVPKNIYPKLLLFDDKGLLISENPPRPDETPMDLIKFIRRHKD